jgi:hypothetical protein
LLSEKKGKESPKKKRVKKQKQRDKIKKDEKEIKKKSLTLERERGLCVTTLPEYPCSFRKSVCHNLLFMVLCVHLISFKDPPAKN